MEDLVEFLRMELCVVEQQFVKSQSAGGAMEDAASRPDADVEAVEAAKRASPARSLRLGVWRSPTRCRSRWGSAGCMTLPVKELRT